MSDENSIQLSKLISISADDWRNAKHQIEENKKRLDLYSKHYSSFFEDSQIIRNRIGTIESWKESLMFWLRFAAWSVLIIVAIFLFSTAGFVLSHKGIRSQYLNQISKPLASERGE